MTQTIQHNLQQQWSSIEGAGPRVMELKGQEFAKTLQEVMDKIASDLSTEFGVNLQEISWQRNKTEQQQR